MKGLKTLFRSAALLTVLALGITSCKKDKATTTTAKGTDYATLTRADIISADSSLSDKYITATTADNIYFKKGDVYIYVTKSGLYGKLQIDSIDATNNYAFTFDATTFKADGSVSKQATELVIHGTWSCDLDNLEETSDNNATDFFWDRSDDYTTYLDPYNGAKLAKYSFAK